MATQVILPKLTYEMEEGRIVEWLCEEGNAVDAGQALFVVETDKASIEVQAEEAGILLRVLVPTDATVPVGAAVAWIGAPGDAIPEAEALHPPKEQQAVSSPQDIAVTPRDSETAAASPVAASPVAKRLARELGVALEDVQKHVGQKRIREADIRAYADARSSAMGTDGPEAAGDAEFELIKPSPLQRAMASHLSQAAAIPQAAASCEVNLTSLELLRNELSADWEASHGFRLSFTHMLAPLVARALESCPTLNATWTDEGIRLYRTINLGVAMASDRGLVVPVVRGANQLSLAEIASEIIRLQRATMGNRLHPKDLEGGTFTITNVGMLGITLSIPLLNPPQSGILAVGAKRAQLVLTNGQPVTIPVTLITVTFDHRVVDGVAAAAFLQRLKELMENPRSILG
ncbi:MAG: dihydrolipoamide acetyltransferase family protein [Caldilineaceae bacterium]|nr:dihydrolipoamide acetyltransferase family protein [Caldilineaceae bacterium]MCY3992239.1 dihydrolipoamide acetyltransferase family protein [Caldilineaceae bacterium]